MNDDLTLYAYPFRSRAERVLWVLDELGFRYRLLRVSPFVNDRPNPELLRLNPDGKVPILIHDGKIFLESLAIMEYLNSISQTRPLIPTETDHQYDFRRLLHYGLTEMEPYLWLAEQANGPLKQFYHWPAGVYEESISRVEKSCRAVTGFLTNGDYLVKSGFSIADIYYYHVLTWAMQHGIQHAPEIENYLCRLENRDSFPASMYWKANV